MPDETPGATTTTQQAHDDDNASLPPLESIPDNEEFLSLFINPNDDAVSVASALVEFVEPVTISDAFLSRRNVVENSIK